MSHKIAQITFPSLLVLRRHRYGPGQFYLNWPMWNNKKKQKNIPFGRKGGISLLMCWIGISSSQVERLPSFNPLLVVVWPVQAPFTVTWVIYRTSCPILFRSDQWWRCNFLELDESDVIPEAFCFFCFFSRKMCLFSKRFWSRRHLDQIRAFSYALKYVWRRSLK